ncbi:MAG: excisionase [Gammaproteobacteria bacterium]|jgi:hypothetical protein|nr:excisionase [Gammaproteobacteria bacterium]MBT4892454.1 excisionase [Gammaproteobacteria bacterium]
MTTLLEHSSAAEFVKLTLFEKLTGYSPNAAHIKIRTGVWEEGKVWVKAPDGKILIVMSGYYCWCRSGFSG